MNARKCDRCGQFYDLYDGRKVFSGRGYANGLMLINEASNGDYDRQKLYDLCPGCMEELMAFIKNRDKSDEISN